MRKYRVLKDSRLEKRAKTGTIVYDLRWSDTGISGSDTRNTGIKHISVTLDENGDYPFFTIPVTDLEKIE